jgi:hypothetical protein
MSPHIDLGTFLSPSWSRDYGNRAFQYDAFISHNNRDRYSKDLVKEMNMRGATVWHDHDQDLRDRQVKEAVGQALFRSRSVIVSIDDSFHDSAWCRSEYIPALEVARSAKATRVIVARMVSNCITPEQLKSAPHFECYQRGELDRLAAEIQKSNRVPFNANYEDPPGINAKTLANVETLHRMIMDAYDNDSNSEALASVASAMMQGDMGQHQWQEDLMIGRQTLLREAKMSAFSKADLDFLTSAALYFCGSRNPDNRANGMFILCHLAEHDPTRSLHDEVFRAIRREPNATLINEIVFPWFEGNWTSFDAQQQSEVEMFAMRDPTHARYYSESLVNKFSEVTRVRVFARGLETQVLPYGERMQLLEERAGYILSETKHTTQRSRIDGLLMFMGIHDIEPLFHELDSLLFEDRVKPRSEFENVAVRVIDLIHRITSHSKEHEGQPLIAMEEYVLDYVLKPLLWCARIPDATSRAQNTFDSVCQLLKTYSSLAYKVPFYREYLDITLSGADTSGGLFSECFEQTRLRLHEATAEHLEREAIESDHPGLKDS